MSNKLNMQDIIDLLVAKNDISKEEAEMFVSQLFSLIEKGLSDDKLVKVKDFGTFKLTPIQERESVDVNTQEKIVIPAHRRVSFVPAPILKSLVNKPFAHFETTPLNDGIFLDGVSHDTSSENEDDDSGAYEDLLTPTSKEGTSDITNPIIVIVDESESQKTNDEDKNTAPSISNVEENNIINSTPEEELKAYNEEITHEEISIPRSSEKTRFRNHNLRKRLRTFIFRWEIAIAFFMILGVGFAYNYYFAKNNLSKQSVEDSDIPKLIKVVTPTLVESKSNEPNEVIDSVKTMEIVKAVETVKMSPGRTLRLIALEKYGEREFWVYIYMKNKDRIKNPDVIPVGLILELPHEDEFDLDAKNPNDISKAKKLGDQVMKTFW